MLLPILWKPFTRKELKNSNKYEFHNKYTGRFNQFLFSNCVSLLIGLEQRRYHYDDPKDSTFGMDRTYTLTGILGYILYIITPAKIWFFATGGLVVALFLAIFYWKKIESQGKFGITSMITILITYNLAPLLYTKPIWVTILVVTTVLILIEMKEQLKTLGGKFDNNDFIILAKFLAISGIILPLLPHEIMTDFIPISPFKFWLVVVAVSAVSYLSYLLKKFIFKKNGMLITGFLGGLYSSTATTVVLARKSKQPDTALNQASASIMLATGMMFIRIYILILLFNQALARLLILPFVMLTALSFIISWLILRFEKTGKNTEISNHKHKNPLEFKTALLFAFLFVFFAVITKYVLHTFGIQGLDILSLVVGVTDIDPFLMSLFTGKYHIEMQDIARATLIAVSSNNLMKLGYALVLGDKSLRKSLVAGFTAIVIATVVIICIL